MSAWSVRAVAFRDGLVGQLDIIATRKWRCGVTGAPKSVVTEAMQLARVSGL